MMKSLVVILFVGVLAVHANDPQASVALKFTTMVTSFLKQLQVEQVCDAAVPKVCAHASTQEIVDAAMDKAMDVLEGSQYITGMNLINKAMKAFGNMSAINETIQLCVGGASPVVMPLYTTLYEDKIQNNQSGEDCSAIVYEFADSKFKLKLIKKIAKACVKKLSNDQLTKAKSVLSGIIDFKKLGI